MQLGKLSFERGGGLCGKPCVWYFNTYRKENIQKSSDVIARVHLLGLKMLRCFTSCAPNSREKQPKTVFRPRIASILSSPGADQGGTKVRPKCARSYLLFDGGQDGGGGLSFRSVSVGGWHHGGNHGPLLLLRGLLRHRHHFCQHKRAGKKKKIRRRRRTQTASKPSFSKK